MRISDWSPDVCSSDLTFHAQAGVDRLGVELTDERVVLAAARAAQVLVEDEVPDLDEAVTTGVDLGAAVGAVHGPAVEIGRASCRERVCEYVWISEVAVHLKKKTTKTNIRSDTY